MPQTVQQLLQPQDAPAAPLRPEALHLRRLSVPLHADGAPEAAPAPPHQRAALQLRRLPQTLHQRLRPAHTLEVDPVRPNGAAAVWAGDTDVATDVDGRGLGHAAERPSAVSARTGDSQGGTLSQAEGTSSGIRETS